MLISSDSEEDSTDKIFQRLERNKRKLHAEQNKLDTKSCVDIGGSNIDEDVTFISVTYDERRPFASNLNNFSNDDVIFVSETFSATMSPMDSKYASTKLFLDSPGVAEYGRGKRNRVPVDYTDHFMTVVVKRGRRGKKNNSESPRKRGRGRGGKSGSSTHIASEVLDFSSPGSGKKRKSSSASPSKRRQEPAHQGKWDTGTHIATEVLDFSSPKHSKKSKSNATSPSRKGQGQARQGKLESSTHIASDPNLSGPSPINSLEGYFEPIRGRGRGRGKQKKGARQGKSDSSTHIASETYFSDSSPINSLEGYFEPIRGRGRGRGKQKKGRQANNSQISLLTPELPGKDTGGRRQSKRIRTSIPTYCIGDANYYPDQSDHMALFKNKPEKPPVNDIDIYLDNEEISVKVLWQRMEVVKFKIRKLQKISQIFDFFSERESVTKDKLLFMYNNNILRPDDTPDSIDYSFVKFIDGGVTSSGLSLPQEDPPKAIAHGFRIKFQCQGIKKPFIVAAGREEKLQIALIKCAEHLELPITNLRFQFDGEIVRGNLTPKDLDMDNGDCIDVNILNVNK